MENPFFSTAAAATRTEALRWLAIAEKLLAAHDLLGSKSFAARAHDADPTLSQAGQILAVVDTLLAAERRNQPDWYKVLRLTPPQGRDAGLVTAQYRRLVLLLNPQTNKFPFAEQAFRLVFDAYSALSNPSRRSLYDKELAFHSQPNPFSDPMPASSQNIISFGGGGSVIQDAVHGGLRSGVSGSHSAQVQPQNFMGFTNSGHNLAFGSGSKSGYEAVGNQVHSSYGVGGHNVVSEQLNHLHNQSLQNSSTPSDETIHNVNVAKNVGENFETMEDNEDVMEVVDVVEEEDEDEGRVDTPTQVVGDGSSFWTACPYCFYMYEYPHVYVDCTLKCQNCKRAFQAVVIQSPPPIVEGQKGYLCCWGFLPFGFSMEDWQKHNASASIWAPFTQMGNNMNQGVGGAGASGHRDYGDDNEDFVAISDSSESDEDWHDVRGKYVKNEAKKVKGEGGIATRGSERKARVGVDKGKALSTRGVELPKKLTSEPSKMGLVGNAGKQPGRAAKNFGKLDLNVELSIETEEPATRTNQGSGSGRGEDDNIEGTGFFEGLDEFLSSLPILNVVGDDKVVKAV